MSSLSTEASNFWRKTSSLCRNLDKFLLTNSTFISRSVSGLVSRGRLIRSGLILRSFSVSRVLNISNVSSVSISNGISHSLSSAIGQQNRVLSIGSITISRFFLVEIDSAVIVLNGVSVVVVGGSFFVRGGGSVRGGGTVSVRGAWVVAGVGDGKGQNGGKSNKYLQ